MEIVILSLLIICEIALLVYSIICKYRKNEWCLNKLLAHGTQLIFFLALLFTPAVALNIRYKLCFIILVFRVFISAIAYLLSKNKNEYKPVPFMVLNAIANILVLILATVPSFVFSDYDGLDVSGTHNIATTSFIMIDSSREDPFEGEGSHREVPVHAFYPEDADSDNEYPLVVFSHGAFGYYQSNMSSYQELASNGYVVLALDHPHHSFYTENSSGRTITVDPNFINSVMYINGTDAGEDEIFKMASEWVKLRVDDVNFVLDEFKNAKVENSIPSNWFTGNSEASDIENMLSIADTDHIGLFGHSLGGATAVTVGRMRNDIDAVIDLDGTMLGEELDCKNGEYVFYDEAYPVPLLSMESESHHTQADEIGVLYVNRFVCSKAKDAKVIWFKGSAHMNFTDLPLFSPFLASRLGTGTIDPESCIRQINDLILNYFDYYLKNSGELTIKECYQ